MSWKAVRPSSRWEDNIRLDLKETGCGTSSGSLPVVNFGINCGHTFGFYYRVR
jgi:hypothetical protein